MAPAARQWPASSTHRFFSVWDGREGSIPLVSVRTVLIRRRRAQTWVFSLHKAFFSDLNTLGGPTAWDLLQHKPISVPQVDLFIAAFECDAHSSLSIYRKQGPGSLQRGTLSSAKGVLSYIQTHRPRVWIGENVKQLASATDTCQSDVDTLRDMLNSIGYQFAWFRTRAETYGSPAPRERTVVVAHPPVPLCEQAGGEVIRSNFDWQGQL